jgi:hypothetical protein
LRVPLADWHLIHNAIRCAGGRKHEAANPRAKKKSEQSDPLLSIAFKVFRRLNDRLADVSQRGEVDTQF